MSLYNGPPRAGSRGGRDQFNWDSVKSDKDREFYLGHSLKAPVGRWQKGKDLLWYTKTKNDASSLRDELRAVKAKEEELMLEALGLKPKAAKPVSQPSMDKNELAQLLKKGADDEDQPDPDSVKGLGYAPGGMNAAGSMHTTLAGEGLDMPVRPAPAAGSGTRLPPPPPLTAAAAQAMKLQGLSKAERKALKKAAKQAKKAKKEKKEKKPKKEKKRKAGSSSSGSSSSEEEASQAPVAGHGAAGKRGRLEDLRHAPAAAAESQHAKRPRLVADDDMVDHNDRRYNQHYPVGAAAVRRDGHQPAAIARGRHDTPDRDPRVHEPAAADRRPAERRRHDSPDPDDRERRVDRPTAERTRHDSSVPDDRGRAVDRRTAERTRHDSPDGEDRRRPVHGRHEAAPSDHRDRRRHDTPDRNGHDAEFRRGPVERERDDEHYARRDRSGGQERPEREARDRGGYGREEEYARGSVGRRDGEGDAQRGHGESRRGEDRQRRRHDTP